MKIKLVLYIVFAVYLLPQQNQFFVYGLGLQVISHREDKKKYYSED